jgi:AraC family transcriptional regulator
MPSRPPILDPRRAEYAARFNRVVDHIQAHLTEPMRLETLAEVACFSPCHFHRLFHAWMGETIHDFTLRLRVERAAFRLIYDPARSITEIALDCGFSSSATFARAFKGFHGVSASDWRKYRKICKTDHKNSKAELPAVAPSSEAIGGSGPRRTRDLPMAMKVEVQQLPTMHVAYIRHRGPFQENAALFERLFGQICGWAGPRGLLGLTTAKFLSVHHDNPDITEAGKLRLDMAVTVPEATQVHGEIGKQRLAGGAYAVARVRIDASQYGDAWDALMGDWLPDSGYQPDDRPDFEVYLDDLKVDPEGPHEVELCLAVKPL